MDAGTAMIVAAAVPTVLVAIGALFKLPLAMKDEQITALKTEVGKLEVENGALTETVATLKDALTEEKMRRMLCEASAREKS